MNLDALNMIATEHISKVLEESLYMQDRIFSHLPIIAILCNDHGNIVRINYLAAEFFRLNKGKNPLGEKIWEYFTGDSKRYFEDFFNRKSLNNEFNGKESFLDIRSKEEFIFWQTHCVKRGNQRKGIFIILGTNTRELRRTYEAEIFQLARRNSVMTLAAGMAHEFNNPLMILETLISRISRASQTNQEVLELSKKATHHLGRISQFVGKFKSFGYDSEDHWEELNIHMVINDAIDIVQSELSQNAIKVERDLHKDVPKCLGNRHSLIEMIMAVIANAKDAVLLSSKKERIIRITTTLEAGRMIRISIWDNGIGIKEDILDRVFDPFYTTKNIGKGQGLGLTLAYSVARSHHGAINIISEHNQHTQVDIRIPAEQDQKI